MALLALESSASTDDVSMRMTNLTHHFRHPSLVQTLRGIPHCLKCQASAGSMELLSQQNQRPALRQSHEKLEQVSAERILCPHPPAASIERVRRDHTAL